MAIIYDFKTGKRINQSTVHKPIDKPVDSNVDNSDDEDVKLAKQIAKYYMTHSEKQTYEQFRINLNKQSDVRQIFKLIYGETRNHYFADHPTAPRPKSMMTHLNYDPAFKDKHNSFRVPHELYPCTDDQIYWIGRYYLNHTSNETINKYSNYCDGDLSQIDLTQLFYLCYDNFTKQEWSYRVYRCKLNNRRRQQWKNRILKRKNYG